MNKLFNIHGAMICASAEAEARTFTKVAGKRGIWYVSTDDNAADNIYVCNSNKEGMAGRHLSFRLVDGHEEKVHAPWHSNSLALLADTGIDLTDKHLMSYVISLKRESTGGWYSADNMIDVIEDASKPRLMSYDRPKQIAQEYADALGHNVFLSQKSSGGGCARRVEPTRLG